ncbi:MAG: RHS repeat-associated core domain-containing protein [Bacteroidota bacterium]
MFEKTYGFSVPDYSKLLCVCDAAARTGGITGPLQFPIDWTTDKLTALQNAVITNIDGIENLIQVPAGLACDNCIKCSVFAATSNPGGASNNDGLNDRLIAAFGTADISLIDQALLTTFLNSTYNMNNTYNEWVNFIASCNTGLVVIPGQPTLPPLFTAGVTSPVLKLADILSQLNQVTNGFTTNTTFNKTSVPAFFSSGIYPPNSLNDIACQQIDVAISYPSATTFAVTLTPNTTCSNSVSPALQPIVLTLTTYPTSNIAFSIEDRLYDFKMSCPNVFFIKHEYTDGAGVIVTDYLAGTISTNVQVFETHHIVDENSCGPLLCSHDFSLPPPPNDCITSAVNNALNTAKTKYNTYITGEIEKFKNNYKAHCYGEVTETFERHYNSNEYNYTLYYYDQAGNLVHTVPPKGVTLLTPAQTASAILNIQDPVNNPPVYPAHSINNNRMVFPGPPIVNTHYVTDYTYNTYDQPLLQTTPDGGATRYLYDHVGRLAASNNAKQGNKYSYTLYDEFGRIIEFGQLLLSSADVLTEAIVKSPTLWAAFVNGVGKGEVTKTIYDAPLNGNVNSLFGSSGQQNIRNRVTATTYEEFDDNNPSTYEYASYFSYDDHGNVSHMIQDNLSLDALGTTFRYKHVQYEYDLVSGNVNTISYQKGQADQFYHNYFYDADNRLHEVETSLDGVIWDKDAKYFFYEHGPLARTELGQNQVQGTDYAYNIQGWLKGINSTTLAAKKDIGKDAALGNVYMQAFSGMHQHIAKDAASFNLNYFNGDYAAINGTTGTSNDFVASTASLTNPLFDLSQDAPGLFNGNISSMVTTITNIDQSSGNYLAVMPQITAYKYDQLHRIKEMKAFSTVDFSNAAAKAIDLPGNVWSTPTANNFKNVYASAFSYDKNGNIINNNRSGHYDIGGAVTKEMDQMVYHYIPNTNQLDHVVDNAYGGLPDSYYGDDIETQTANNYVYDEIGQLIKDEKEEIFEILWNNHKKISAVIRTATSTKPNLYFHYDGMGHRIRKTVMPQTAGVEDPANRTITHYVLDADGNQLSIYEEKYTSASGSLPNDHTLKQEESTIFGSERLGVVDHGISRILYALSSGIPVNTPELYEHVLGKKIYEIANHLGNVISTVTDWKTRVNDGVYNLVTGALTSATPDGMVDYYQPIIISATDYYPFGSVMPGRNFKPNTGSGYRYNFNGKESDIEIVVTSGGTQDYGQRIYNPGLGRFLSVDPISHTYPELTPYQFASNTPIWAVDLDGLEARIYTDLSGVGHTFLSVVDDKQILHIFTYGQYSQGYDDGKSHPVGKGALIHLVGKAAEAYLKKEFTENNMRAFELSANNIHKEKVIEYYERILNDVDAPAAEDKNDVRFTMLESGSKARQYSYYAGVPIPFITDNCVTVANKGLEAGGSLILTGEVLPQSVYFNLQAAATLNFPKDMIKDVTKDVIKDVIKSVRKNTHINPPINSSKTKGGSIPSSGSKKGGGGSNTSKPKSTPQIPSGGA